MPLLNTYGFRATFFIYTRAIGAPHFMDAAEIRGLADAGMEIGSHSRSHPYLARITDPAVLRSEIVDSRARLERSLRIDESVERTESLPRGAGPVGHLTAGTGY